MPSTSTSDPSALEIGVKFRSDVAGSIAGIRFYKGAPNSGVHTGRTWTSSGTLLAQGVFSNETASGWQQLVFATPVPIAANTTYIAAYHSAGGGFSYNLNYFAATGADNAPLHALRSGLDGGNGVYLYTSTPGFPSLSSAAANYWVDVVFLASSSGPTLATIAPNAGIAGTIVPVTLTGSNLTGATLNLGSDLTASNVTVTASQITASLAIAANALPSAQNVSVTTAGGTSNTVTFSIIPPAPVLAPITPSSGMVGTIVPVTLTGTNLSGATLNLGFGLTASNVTVTASQIIANLAIAANALPGAQNITVTTAGGTSNTVVFTVNPSVVTLTSITPASALAGTTVAVTLVGTSLSGATLDLGPGMTANNVTVSASQITANLVIAFNAPPGPQNITVTATGGTSNPVVFKIRTTIWPTTGVPAVIMTSDASPVVLGVKFRSDVAGYITGIRFYKGSPDGGTHTAQLFSATGTVLAQGVFSNETDSGWQQFDFQTPIAIAANTTYIAAYHTTSGRFAYDLGYFGSASVDHAPLHALRNGVDGPNGVYLYTPNPGFPQNTYNSTCYWVDVVFAASVL